VKRSLLPRFCTSIFHGYLYKVTYYRKSLKAIHKNFGSYTWYRARICKLLRCSGIDSKESIPRNRSQQPGGPERQPCSSYRPPGFTGWIPGLLKSLQYRAQYFVPLQNEPSMHVRVNRSTYVGPIFTRQSAHRSNNRTLGLPCLLYSTYSTPPERNQAF
jgi:hypothetical protein